FLPRRSSVVTLGLPAGATTVGNQSRRDVHGRSPRTRRLLQGRLDPFIVGEGEKLEIHLRVISIFSSSLRGAAGHRLVCRYRIRSGLFQRRGCERCPYLSATNFSI